MSLVFISMLFFHIIDDFHLQGWLASAKQKEYWRNLPEYSKKYQYDYIICLIIHGFGWACLMMLPILIYKQFNVDFLFIEILVLNGLVHACIDDMKCNLKYISLLEDQLWHLGQIIITFVLLVMI